MKMLFIFCTSSAVVRVRELIEAHDAHGFTEIPEVRGSGETGRRLGSRAYPGASSIVITAAPEPKAIELIEALARLSETCCPDEGIRVYQIGAERAL